ncbi:MAG: hypothetical protein JWR26_3308 [Pedosphaera sp.]|nr:hypothetical protein [Pedosphaera sp.]
MIQGLKPNQTLLVAMFAALLCGTTAGSPSAHVSTQWNVINWPISYVLDPNGVIRFKAMDDGANLDDAVDQVMSEFQSQQQAKKM